MTTNLTGLRASVFREAGLPDCSNGGISARVDRVVVVAVLDYLSKRLPEVHTVRGPSTAGDDCPAVALVMHSHFGRGVSVSAQPYGEGVPLTGWMSGGTYIATSDERFGEASGFYGAVALHDRRED